MIKHPDEIKGSLNTFKKMVESVDYAVEVMNEYEKIQQSVREAQVLAADEQKKLEHLRAAVDEGIKTLKETRDSAKKLIVDAESEAEDIVSSAQEKASDIVKKAANEIIPLEASKAALVGEINDLRKKRDDTQTQAIDAQGKLDKVKAEIKRIAG